jgi:hypothetical protein
MKHKIIIFLFLFSILLIGACDDQAKGRRLSTSSEISPSSNGMECNGDSECESNYCNLDSSVGVGICEDKPLDNVEEKISEKIPEVILKVVGQLCSSNNECDSRLCHNSKCAFVPPLYSDCFSCVSADFVWCDDEEIGAGTYCSYGNCEVNVISECARDVIDCNEGCEFELIKRNWKSSLPNIDHAQQISYGSNKYLIDFIRTYGSEGGIFDLSDVNQSNIAYQMDVMEMDSSNDIFGLNFKVLEIYEWGEDDLAEGDSKAVILINPFSV